MALTRNASADLTDVKAVASKNTHYLTCDTGHVKSIESFAHEAKKLLSGKQIDFLISNAGINDVPDQSSLSIGPEDLERQIRVNVIGPAKTAEFLLAHDLLAKDARIVNMTSGLGSMDVSKSITPRKCATYSISKGALNMLTVHQSGDLKEKLPGCVVICMDPGWVKTRMGGVGAVLEPEESISGMLKRIQSLTEAETGKFFTYTGKEVPW